MIRRLGRGKYVVACINDRDLWGTILVRVDTLEEARDARQLSGDLVFRRIPEHEDAPGDNEYRPRSNRYAVVQDTGWLYENENSGYAWAHATGRHTLHQPVLMRNHNEP